MHFLCLCFSPNACPYNKDGMKHRKPNIFIAQTPLQNFIASKIVEQFFRGNGNKNMLFTSAKIDDASCFDEYFPIEKDKVLHKISDTYLAKIKIKKELKSDKCSLFIPHTSALLSNYFFYGYSHGKKEVDINFYYDGILYYYEYDEPYRPKLHISRKIFAFLIGFKYRRIPRIFPANHPEINKIYSIFPEFTIGPAEKMVKVSLLKEKYVGQKNHVLIIGGKPSLLTDEEVIGLYGLMIEKILLRNENIKVYFKGHHADRSSNFHKANNGRLAITDITQNSPVEEIIEAYSPGTVLSYPSSALVSLKAMYGDNIEIFSYYKKEKKQLLAELWPIFEKLNIHTDLS